jgi:hypothetical protein
MVGGGKYWNYGSQRWTATPKGRFQLTDAIVALCQRWLLIWLIWLQIKDLSGLDGKAITQTRPTFMAIPIPGTLELELTIQALPSQRRVANVLHLPTLYRACRPHLSHQTEFFKWKHISHGAPRGIFTTQYRGRCEGILAYRSVTTTENLRLHSMPVFLLLWINIWITYAILIP